MKITLERVCALDVVLKKEAEEWVPCLTLISIHEHANATRVKALADGLSDRGSRVTPTEMFAYLWLQTFVKMKGTSFSDIPSLSRAAEMLQIPDDQFSLFEGYVEARCLFYDELLMSY